MDDRDLRAELDRILANDAFSNAGRMSRLLRYVVERALAGEGDQLKEYVLGIEVFDRGDGYDPRLDSIVRVEARRLRSKLDEYYRTAGAADPVLISIPRGSYAPVFERRERRSEPALPASAPAQTRGVHRAWLRGALMAGLLVSAIVLMLVSMAWRPGSASGTATVAVLPFEQHSGLPDDRRLASGLTDAVTFELARLQTVGVVSRTSARQFEGVRRPLHDIAAALRADVIMEATVFVEDGRLRLEARLVDGVRDRKFWVQTFSGTPAEASTIATRTAIAVAEAVAHRP